MLTRASARYLTRHPWLLLLSLVGVALGVAVVVAVDLANESATSAFGVSTETVAGRATHSLEGASGTVPDSLLGVLRAEGVRPSAPVATGYVTTRGRVVQLMGIDPLSDGPFRNFTTDQSGGGLDLFLSTPGTVFLSPDAAGRLRVSLGDTLGVTYQGVRHVLRVADLLDPGDAQTARVMESLLIADIGTAQTVLGLQDRLTRIDLIADEATAERIGKALPASITVGRPEARSQALERMTDAFRLNLTALSFLALVVGVFLVYNTTTFSVVQRRTLIGYLRAVGVTRREVFGLVLGEALVIGLIGTILGVLLGIVLGRGLVELVSQTINDLYFTVAISSFDLSAWTIAKGILLGVGATAVAALLPAYEAAHTPVATVVRRSSSEDGLRRVLPRLSAAGVLLLAIGTGVLAWPSVGLVAAYAALLAAILGFALLVPALTVGFGRLVRPLAGWIGGATGRMAAGGLEAHLSRVSVAVAALAVAVAATIGVGTMIGSFRETVVVWLEGALVADVYAQPPSLVARRGEASLTPEVVRALAEADGVASFYSIRNAEVLTPDGEPTQLIAIRGGEAQERTFRLKTGDPGVVWPRLRSGEAVLISEPLSLKRGLAPGDTLRLVTDRGPRGFPIAGVFFDYASDLGVAMIYRSTYEQLYADRGVSGMAFYAQPGVSPDSLVERMRAAVAGEQDVILRSNAGLRQYSMDIFDRTFTITSVLRLLAMAVAFVGILSALMALQLERARELATLRAVGMTRREVGGLIGLQTGLMGLAAGLLSLPLGLGLAAALIFVVNRRSFGWTLQFSLTPGILLTALALALVAALLAGVYPAWRMAQSRPADALREG
jgi:putative ABC transport system permease protein